MDEHPVWCSACGHRMSEETFLSLVWFRGGDILVVQCPACGQQESLVATCTQCQNTEMAGVVVAARKCSIQEARKLLAPGRRASIRICHRRPETSPPSG